MWVHAADIQGNTAILGALDKVTGRVSTITARVGTTVDFGSLNIKVFACYYKPPEEAPDNVSFLNISENVVAGDDKEKRLQHFNGWMFSSSPAISALEHGMYDIWSVECRNIDYDAQEKADK